MKTKCVLHFCLIGSALLLSGCAGNVSGRFDMQQRFATGVEIREANRS